MILQNITKAIREQNWFAVVLEFVIVIAGVVIGFQITGWAGELDDRETEARHITEIADDLRMGLSEEIGLSRSVRFRSVFG